MEIGFFILVFCIGFIATFLGSFLSGGVSTISVLSLTALGMPPHVVLGTQRLGLVGADIGGFIRFLRTGKIIWPLVLPLIVFGSAGAYIGSQIIFAVDEAILSRVIGLAILVFIPFSIWKPKLGVERYVVSTRRKVVGYLSYFLATIWGASFHIGVGLFITYTHLYFFGNTILEAKATDKVPGFTRNVFVLTTFALAGFVDWQLGIALLMGMFIGANIGTKYVIQIGDEWLRKILLVTIGLLAVKLVFGF